MKVALITDAWHPQVNGVVTTLAKVVKILESNFDCEVKIFEPSMCKQFPLPGYNEIKLSINPWKTLKEFKEFQPDVIHIATEGTLGIFYRYYCKKHNISYNTSYHTKFPEYLNEYLKLPLSIGYFFERWFHQYSKKVLVTTETVRGELSKHNFNKEMIIWERGVDLNFFRPRVGETKNELPVLLNVGRISLEKNLEDFFSLDIPNTRKRMVGDGPMRKKYEKKYPSVEFVGYKTGKELAKEYANADVFVFPSKSDTFGNVILESLSCGTPVAGYDVSGTRDILTEGINGYYMSDDLKENVINSLKLNRKWVRSSVEEKSWYDCVSIFYYALIFAKK